MKPLSIRLALCLLIVFGAMSAQTLFAYPTPDADDVRRDSLDRLEALDKKDRDAEKKREELKKDRDERDESADSEDVAKRRAATDAEFDRSTFVDSQFGKTSFRDLLDAGRRFRQKRDGGMKSSYDGEDDGDTGAVLTVDLFDFARPDAFLWKRRMRPVQNRLGDWVPDKVDPIANGGFEVAPDNGSPVPYRLNGHVDIERGYPWDADN